VVARVDLVTDPRIRVELAQARLGQAYFSRKLNELSNDVFGEPSRLAGWTRARIVAQVGYQARALTRLVESAETGVPQPEYESAAERDEEVDLGASLAVRALRHLSDHAGITLDVAWRDLPDERWSTPVRRLDGTTIPVSDTVWLRSRELWLRALQLGNGARLADVPSDVRDRLEAEGSLPLPGIR
jgi:maleylpyruvate isomerase